MVKCGVLFEVRAELLNIPIIYMSFGFKGLIECHVMCDYVRFYTLLYLYTPLQFRA
jgi:hypothetical protein